MLHYSIATTSTTTAATTTTLQLQVPQNQPHLQLQYKYNYSYSYNSFTLHYIPLHHTTLPLTTLHYSYSNYSNYCSYRSYKYNITTTTTTTSTTPTTTPQYQHNCNYNYSALHYTTLHPAIVVEATTATTPKNTTPTPITFRSISSATPRITTPHFSDGFLSLKLSPPPCTVILVIITMIIDGDLHCCLETVPCPALPMTTAPMAPLAPWCVPSWSPTQRDGSLGTASRTLGVD